MPEFLPTTDGSAAPGAPGGESGGSLKGLAIRGAVWTVSGFGAAQLIRFALNLALTRLLFPELFGLMTLVTTVIMGINLFCDFGVNAIVVRDPRGDDPVFLDTIWTVQILRGLLIAAVTALAGIPASHIYGDARLSYLIPVIGLTALIGGFNSTSLLTLQRHLAVPPLVFVEVGSQLLSGVVMLLWAWAAPGVWALMAGNLAGAAIRLVWSYFLPSLSAPRLGWDRLAVREIFDFARWVWIATVLSFWASQIDRLVLGKIFTLEMLGVYGIAATLAEMPRSLINAISSNVSFPAFSKVAGLPRPDLRARIIRYRWPLLITIACIVALLTAGGDAIIRILYDKRYADGMWMLPLLALGIWPSALSSTIKTSLTAIGQPRYSAFANAWKILFTAVGIPVAFGLFGVRGAVAVVALNDVFSYGQISYGLWREGLAAFSQDLKATLLFIALLALALLARAALGWGFPLQRHV